MKGEHARSCYGRGLAGLMGRKGKRRSLFEGGATVETRAARLTGVR